MMSFLLLLSLLLLLPLRPLLSLLLRGRLVCLLMGEMEGLGINWDDEGKGRVTVKWCVRKG